MELGYLGTQLNSCMWILHFLPDSVLLFFTNALLIAGIVLVVAGLFAQRIPLIWKYQLPFKIAGLVLFAAGIYFRGGYAVEMDWREKVEQAEQQARAAEQKANELNEKLDKVTKERNALLKKKSQVIIQQVDNVVVDPRCVNLPKEFISIHNEAARMNEAVDALRKGQQK